VASRFYRCQKAGIWQGCFEAVQQQADAQGQINWAIHYVDGTIVRAPQHAAGSPRGAAAEALGRSQGGFSTKVHLEPRRLGAQHLVPACGPQLPSCRHGRRRRRGAKKRLWNAYPRRFVNGSTINPIK